MCAIVCLTNCIVNITSYDSFLKKLDDFYKLSENTQLDTEEPDSSSFLAAFELALNASERTNDSADKIAISIWDFGGQRVFYTVHHLFLTESSVYILVFNMTEMLSKNEMEQKKCAARLRLWMNSISLHAGLAPVLIVGTHKDVIRESAQHMAISKILQLEFAPIPSFKRVVKNGTLLFFPINNMNPRDEVLAELRSTISLTIRVNSYVKEPVPFSWIGLLDALRLLSQTSPTTKLSTVLTLAAGCGFPSNPLLSVTTETIQALKKFHNLGYLVFYNEKDLHDLIILEPQWLISNITVLIREHNGRHPQSIDEDLRSEFPIFWKDFTKEGKVNSILLSRLWPNLDVRAFKYLLIKFGLLVQLRKDTYLVPSLLPDKDNVPVLRDQYSAFVLFDVDIEVMKSYQNSSTALPLSLLKSRSYLPAGLFDRIVCGLISWTNPEFHRRDRVIAYCKNWIHGTIGGVECVLENNIISGFLSLNTMGATASPVFELIKFMIISILQKNFKDLYWDFFLQPKLCIQENSVFAFASVTSAFQDRENPLPLITEASAPVPPFEFKAWFSLLNQLATYDLFISYRHKTNKKLAAVLYHGFNMFESFHNRRYEIFYDNVRLEAAIEFNVAFTKAMYSSTVVMPLISSETLRSLKNNCTTNAVDNVLLEWWMSFIFFDTRRQNPTGSPIRLTNIFPLVCLHDDEIIFTPESFAGTKKIIFDLQKGLPNEVHQATLLKLKDMLHMVNLQVDPKYYELTVHDIVEKVMDSKASFLPHPAEFIESISRWSSLKSPEFVPNVLSKLLSSNLTTTVDQGATQAVVQTPPSLPSENAKGTYFIQFLLRYI